MNATRAKHLNEIFNREGEGYTALVCRLPQNVLMLTGYLPVLGNTFCVVSHGESRELEVRLAVPKDEEDFVPPGIAVEVKTYSEETMDAIGNTIEAVRVPLGELFRSAGLQANTVVGYEGVYSPIATAYTQVGIPGPATNRLLHSLLLGGYMRDATSIFDELAAIKTEEEITFIRRSEEVARQGFMAARAAITTGATEADVAAATYAALLRAGYAVPGAMHVQPHVHVMTGARAALAYRAFNLTSNAAIAQGDTVMVQMEIGINGYWAELTRTFFVSIIDDAWRKAHQACVAAQDAALQHIRAGASARTVDGAARNVIEKAGFGSAFKHGLGHGFGFQAIDHAAAPLLHPVSHAVLQTGMVHNMEPAVYLEGKGGFRLNDNVAVYNDGNEVLSAALPRDLDWLVVSG